MDLRENIVLDLLDVYEREIRKHCKNKRKVYLFECYKMSYMSEIRDVLVSHKHYSCKYYIFLVFEPKVRVVMSLPIKDKVFNHYVTRFILIPKLEKYLDIRNAATRKGMGTEYARKLFRKYLVLNKGKKFYILKLDISKYFYSIDHEVLRSLLKDKLNSMEYFLICDIIDSSNRKYVNDRISLLERKYGIELPKYEYKKGLPIGNMTSQFLSIFYLYQLDHKIVHDYHIKCYVRYMDDFVLIHENKEYLEKVFLKIKNELENIYKLKVNPKKSFIVGSDEGVPFLGIHYKIKNDRVVSYLPKKRKMGIRKKIKRNAFLFLNHEKSIESMYSSRQCFYYGFSVSKKFLRSEVLNVEKSIFS